MSNGDQTIDFYAKNDLGLKNLHEYTQHIQNKQTPIYIPDTSNHPSLTDSQSCQTYTILTYTTPTWLLLTSELSMADISHTSLTLPQCQISRPNPWCTLQPFAPIHWHLLRGYRCWDTGELLLKLLKGGAVGQSSTLRVGVGSMAMRGVVSRVQNLTLSCGIWTSRSGNARYLHLREHVENEQDYIYHEFYHTCLPR